MRVVGWTVAEVGDSRVRILAYCALIVSRQILLCLLFVRAHGGGAYLQAELADGFAVLARLLGRGRRSQLNVVDAEFIEGCTRVAY
jgi:hypothetical protein